MSLINIGGVKKIDTPETIENRIKIAEAKQYLQSTDWYVMRLVETGEKVPDSISAKRSDARAVVSSEVDNNVKAK